MTASCHVALFARKIAIIGPLVSRNCPRSGVYTWGSFSQRLRGVGMHRAKSTQSQQGCLAIGHNYRRVVYDLAVGLRFLYIPERNGMSGL